MLHDLRATRRDSGIMFRNLGASGFATQPKECEVRSDDELRGDERNYSLTSRILRPRRIRLLDGNLRLRLGTLTDAQTVGGNA